MKRMLAAIGILFALALASVAQPPTYQCVGLTWTPIVGQDCSSFSLFAIDDSGLAYPGFQNTAGRVQVSCAPNPRERTIIFVANGQSNYAGEVDGTYTPTYDGVDNFNPYDGRCYKIADPPLGSSSRYAGGSSLGRIGDNLRAVGIDRVIVVPNAIDGTSIAYWATGQGKGRTQAVINRLKVAGLTLTHITQTQGESDNGLGTSAAAYAAAQIAYVQIWRDAGFAAPYLLSQTSWASGTTSSAVRTGQANSASTAQNVIVDIDTDTLGNGYRQSDQTHWSVSGSSGNGSAMFATIRSTSLLAH